MARQDRWAGDFLFHVWIFFHHRSCVQIPPCSFSLQGFLAATREGVEPMSICRAFSAWQCAISAWVLSWTVLLSRRRSFELIGDLAVNFKTVCLFCDLLLCVLLIFNLLSLISCMCVTRLCTIQSWVPFYSWVGIWIWMSRRRICWIVTIKTKIIQAMLSGKWGVLMSLIYKLNM